MFVLGKDNDGLRKKIIQLQSHFAETAWYPIGGLFIYSGLC